MSDNGRAPDWIDGFVEDYFAETWRVRNLDLKESPRELLRRVLVDSLRKQVNVGSPPTLESLEVEATQAFEAMWPRFPPGIRESLEKEVVAGIYAVAFHDGGAHASQLVADRFALVEEKATA